MFISFCYDGLYTLLCLIFRLSQIVNYLILKSRKIVLDCIDIYIVILHGFSFRFSFILLACTNWRSTFYHHPFPGKTLEFVGFRCTLFNHVHLLEFYDGDGVVLVKYKHVKYFRSAKQYQLKR